MTTLTQSRNVPSLLWQTLRLVGRHFLPLFAIGGIPWAVFSLIPILLGQEQRFADLQRAQVPLSLEQLYPFAWAVLYGAVVFPLVNGALAYASAQALQGQPVRVVEAYRAAYPCWGRLLAVYWGYGAVLIAIGAILTLLVRWYDPTLWQGAGDLALKLTGDLSTCYLLILLTLFTQILVLEGTTLRQAWPRARQLSAGTGWRLVGVLLVLTVAGMMVVEVGLSRAGQWAEVLGSGLTNLLWVVGVTGGIGRGGRGRRPGAERGHNVRLFCLEGGREPPRYLTGRIQ